MVGTSTIIKNVLKFFSISVPIWIIAIILASTGIKYLMMNSEISTLENVIENQAETIEKKVTKISDLTSSVASLESSLDNQNEAIEKLNEEYETERSELANRLERANQLVNERTSRLEELDKELSEVTCEESIKWMKDQSQNISEW